MDPAISELISLQGKTAVLTGAANGIGRAIARRLAEAGASLILADIDLKGLEKLQAELVGTGASVMIYGIDLSEKVNIDQFWQETDGKKVDILINNAGYYPFKKFLEIDEAFLMKIMNVNLFSVMWMCQHYIKAKKKNGCIVNIGSIEAIMPFKKDLGHYSMSKVGVITLTRDLARDFGSRGFRVNAVIPGGILTEGTKSSTKKAIATLDLNLLSDSYNFMQRLPAGRIGKPDEIARMVLVLCSDLASYMYGALVPVDGGFLSA